MVVRGMPVAVLAILLVSASPALAVLPHGPSLELEVSVPGSERAAVVEFTDDQDARMADFTARLGGRWSVDWNEVTGTPHMIVGSGAPFAGRIASAADAEQAARRVVEENPALLGTTVENLAVMQTAQGLGKWSVVFFQTYRGLPVVGGRAHVVLTDEGRLAALGSDVYPVAGVSTAPALTEDEAVAAAGAPVGYDGIDDQITELGLVVLPVNPPAGLSYRLAYKVALRVDDPMGYWVSYVDAADGSILGRYNRIRYAAVEGTSRGEVQFVGYCDGISNLPFENMTVTAVGQGSDNTDENGYWNINVTGGGPFTIQAQFLGPWVDVNVYGLTDASFTGSAYPGTPLAIWWNDANARNDERDAFYNVNHVHAKIKEVDPAYTGMDYRVPCAVNLNSTCNAYWDGNGINFYREGGGCANTAEIGNVVYHEYGHGITDKMYGFNDPPGDLHEGASDVVACYLEDTPIVGTGFYLNNCTAGIRNLQNSLSYPEDLTGEGHHDGQIIGGFHWDAWEYLQNSLGEEAGKDVAWNVWHFGRKLGLPQTQPDQVLWTFIADDDDGNLDNGTPHYDELCQAAENHGFDCPEILVGVIIAHDPLWTTDDPSRLHVVRATVYSTETTLDPDSVLVYYRVDGGDFSDVLMSYNPFLDKYFATIPHQPQSSEVEYYILGVDELGNRKTSPRLAPSDLHAFDVAYLYDPAEEDTGWQLGVPGDDATTGMWQRCDPEGTAAQPEDDHTPTPGTDAFITWCAGGSLGDYDVDTGKTTLLSPVYNVEGLDNVRVKYFRWFTNDTGANPGTDPWVVDISNDGGESWVNVENTYTADHYWRGIKFALSDYFVEAPGEVQLRFVASDYDLGSLVEAGVDDFTLLADTGAGADVEVAGSPAGVPAAYALRQNNPNPFNPQTIIGYDLPRESRVSLRVYDVRGREVRTLVSATQPAGHYAFVWDGQNDDGHGVAAGVYFYQLTAGDFSATQKMILSK